MRLKSQGISGIKMRLKSQGISGIKMTLISRRLLIPISPVTSGVEAYPVLSTPEGVEFAFQIGSLCQTNFII